jgi:predicted RecB family nuclease
LDEVAGDWAMAKYIEAVETQYLSVRNDIMAKILDYNREDLEATWAVLKWLKAK